jgi:hypothetical protein
MAQLRNTLGRHVHRGAIAIAASGIRHPSAGRATQPVIPN